MITSGARSQLLLLSCVKHDDLTILGVARTSTIAFGVCSLLLLSMLSSTMSCPSWESRVLLRFASGIRSLLSLPLSVSSSTMAWPSSEWLVLLQLPLVIVFYYYYYYFVLRTSMIHFWWSFSSGNEVYFCDHLWWLFSTTSGGCSPLLLYYYYYTTTFCVSSMMSWLLWQFLDIVLYYFYFLCIGCNDSTILGVVCTSMITSGDYSSLLLLSVCQAQCLIYYLYFLCVGCKDSTILRVVCTSMITSGNYSPLLLLSMCQPWHLKFTLALSSWRYVYFLWSTSCGHCISGFTWWSMAHNWKCQGPHLVAFSFLFMSWYFLVIGSAENLCCQACGLCSFKSRT